MAQEVKKKMATDIKIFIVACTIIALILAAAIVYLLMPKDIAIVKNNKVTENELAFNYSQNLQFLASAYGGQLDQQTIVAYAKQQALSQAVEVEYLLQEANNNGFTVSKEDINSAWGEMDANIKNNAAAYGVSVNEFCEQGFGVKYNKLKKIYSENVTAQKYREKIIEEMSVDEAEVKAFYEENKDAFDYNKVSHILIAVEEGAEDSVVEERKKKAQDILDRVNNGEDFAELAKEYSEDPGSAQTGGQYDVQKGQMVPEFEEWTFSHEVGDTGLIRTDFGFHVMKLDSVNNTFEAARDTVEYSFKSDKYQTILQEALGEGGEYQVEIKDAFYDFAG